MLFNSWEFLVLLAVTLVFYYLPLGPRVGKSWQVLVLLAGSAVFYAWENPPLLILLSASCLLNAMATERIIFWKKFRSEEGSSGIDRARRWLIWTVAVNLGSLMVFKYAAFLASLLPEGLLDQDIRTQVMSIPLPVGISFYTFQGISLVVDVWRGDISEATSARLGAGGRHRIGSIRDTSFYISFFPQLVAGPIVKAHEFVDQIGRKCFAEIHWRTVRRCLISGYFLKVFVADNLAEQTAMLTLGSEALRGNSPINLLALLYGYSLQIFADFAGYSLIAIGLGALFGYRLPENFRYPYLSQSITEFWRRWHLSLSSWLRDYLYIPLGGNRKGQSRTYFNLFLVMFLGGLWHGAAWKFALWGMLHGICLALERFWFRRSGRVVGEVEQGVVRCFARWLLTFHVTTFLWLTFMMPDMASIAAFFESLGALRLSFSGPPVFSLLFYGGAVVAFHLWGWIKEHRESLSLRLASPLHEGVMHGLMLFLILTNPGAPRGFIYFQF